MLKNRHWNPTTALNLTLKIVSGLLFLALLFVGWRIDIKLQQQRITEDAVRISNRINALKFETQLELNRQTQQGINPEQGLESVLSKLSHQSDFSNIILTQADGTYYALVRGNPQYGLLVTENDTDYAAPPKLLTSEPWWRYYFLTSSTQEARLWPVDSTTDQIQLSISTEQSGTDTHWLFVFDIPIETLLKDSQSNNPKLMFIEPNLANTSSDSWSRQLNAHWQIESDPDLPWIPITLFFFAMAIFFLDRLSRRNNASDDHPFMHIFPALGEELKVLMFETDADSRVTWREGFIDSKGPLLDVQPGDSIRQLLISQPRYLAYWQHSMSGEKFTYEVQEADSAFRVHQFPIIDKSRNYQGTTVLVEDISNLREVEYQLRHQQFHDGLTGLPNRQLFMEQLLHELKRSKRRQEFIAVLALEISGIGEINQRYGHKISDELLITIADNFKQAIRSDDALCRFSNDEFLFTFSDYQQPEALRQLAQKLIDTATATFNIKDHNIGLSANVGIATYPRDARDAGSLVSNAITAMRHARQTGRNRLDYFSEDNARMVKEKWQLEQNLSKAINAHDFELHYQPIFELQSHKCVAAEALLRWPTTNLTPDQFIPLAEETGLIHKLGLFVIESSLRQLSRWKKEGSDLHYISVNLSVLQLDEDNFFPRLESIVNSHPFESGEIVLEITESVMMNTDPKTVRKLERLRSMGFRLAIDDFGTGFSSLNYLKHLPVNFVKVDRSFVNGVCNNSQDAAICEAIIQMTLTMDLQLIAEGVETPEQLNWLAQKGVNYAQGYFYAKAVPSEQFRPYLGLE